MDSINNETRVFPVPTTALNKTKAIVKKNSTPFTTVKVERVGVTKASSSW